MSIDKLQDKIRKLKNPSVIDFGVLPEHIPPFLMEEEGSFVKAYGRFCRELLEGLQGVVPAVRFSLSAFALLGQDAMALLGNLLRFAKAQGYYVFLDIPGALSGQEADIAADTLFDDAAELTFDGIITSCYIGSDSLRPYAAKLKESDKDLFAVIRTSNKTAPELQDLLTGSRLVHMAAADIVNRFAEPLVSRCGYSRVAAVAGASSADSLRSLRTKYKNMFLLLDGYDYPNANAKNCSYAFDRLGHGAAACAGTSVTAAWQEQEGDSREYVAFAVQATERMKKNLTRYVTVL